MFEKISHCFTESTSNPRFGYDGIYFKEIKFFQGERDSNSLFEKTCPEHRTTFVSVHSLFDCEFQPGVLFTLCFKLWNLYSAAFPGKVPEKAFEV
jgi:hypothetical protein